MSITITAEHKKYLSLLLESPDDADVLAAAAQAAHTWGFTPESDEPTDAEWSAAETATLVIVEAIRVGLADGTVTASAPRVEDIPEPATKQEKKDAEFLDKLGI